MKSLKSFRRFLYPFLKNIGSKLRYYFTEYPVTSKATTIVFVLHFAVILVLSIQKKTPPNPIPTKLAIHTHILPRDRIDPIKTLSQTTESTGKQLITKSTQRSTPIKKTDPKTKGLKTTNSQNKNPQDQKRQKLLKELQDSLTKLEQKPTSSSGTSLHIPKEIKELKAISSTISSDPIDGEPSSFYQEILVDHLRHVLTLPAAGFVKVKLTLKSDGNCLDLKILSSDSEVNRLYLEKHLQDLIFPPFSHELEKHSSYVFSLTFYGE